MKIYKVTILVVLFFLPWLIRAENTSIELDLYYQPNQELRIINSSTTELVMNIKGDKELIEMNRKRGITLPFKMVQSKTIKTRSKTGSLEPGGAFSYDVSVEDVTSFTEDKDGNRIKIPDPMEFMVGLKIYGRIKSDHKFDVEQVEGKELNPNQRVMVENTVKALVESIKAPKKSLNVGDHYDVNMDFGMPMPDRAPINVTINNKYTLKNIKNGKAYFDVSTTFKIPEHAESVSLSANGGGNGQMIYDIENKIQEKYSTDMNMTMEITSGETYISSSIKAIATIQTILVKD